MTRAQILAAFDVTEEEVAALDQATGYGAARAQADRERAAFLAWAEQRQAELVADLRRVTGLPWTFDSER